MMQSFFSEKGHEPARCEKLRKETTKLRSQILQYDSNASFDNHPGAGGGGAGGGGKDGGGSEKMTIAKKIGEYCIACELARLFHDMFSTEGEPRTLARRQTVVVVSPLADVVRHPTHLPGFSVPRVPFFLGNRS